ncbi:MAG: hypothetical protein KJ645_13145, partial [Planctomycetes bacterium]|nr:hypothetical protein [Planctomycetota bacterium]
ACRGSRVPMKQLEDFIVEKIAAIGQDPALVAETVAAVRKQVEEQEPDLKAEIQQLRLDIASLKRQKKALAARLTEDGEDTKSLLQEIEQADNGLKESEKRLEEAKATLDGLQTAKIDEKTIQAAIGSFVPVWEHLFPAERERIIRLLIEEVTYNASTGEVEITFRPNGIQALSQEAEEAAA